MIMHPTENEYYYTDKSGLLVFTEKYLLERGYCCKNGCRHCPYGFAKEKQDLASKNSDPASTEESISK
jgi:hypothetical protein